MGRPRKKTRGRPRKTVTISSARTAKLQPHEHNLLHLLLVCASVDRLDSFTQNLEKLHTGFGYADHMIKEKNLTIYSAFPWNQTSASHVWAHVRDEVNASKQNHMDHYEE